MEEQVTLVIAFLFKFVPRLGVFVQFPLRFCRLHFLDEVFEQEGVVQ